MSDKPSSSLFVGGHAVSLACSTVSRAWLGDAARNTSRTSVRYAARRAGTPVAGAGAAKPRSGHDRSRALMVLRPFMATMGVDGHGRRYLAGRWWYSPPLPDRLLLQMAEAHRCCSRVTADAGRRWLRFRRHAPLAGFLAADFVLTGPTRRVTVTCAGHARRLRRSPATGENAAAWPARLLDARATIEPPASPLTVRGARRMTRQVPPGMPMPALAMPPWPATA